MKVLARMFEEAANLISPIALFEKQQAAKLSGELGSWRGFRSMPMVSKGYEGSGRSMISDWWAGHDLEQVGTAIGGIKTPKTAPEVSAAIQSVLSSPGYQERMSRAAFYRRAATGVLAAGTVGRYALGDNMVSDIGSNAIGAGVALGGAGALFHSGGTGAKLLGYGLMGLSVRNVLSPGDNWGPF